MQSLKYVSYDIVFQEVPNETSLVFNISGCPHKCPDCHSKYLWDYTGNILKNDIESIIQRYCDYVTCVCFMGGDQNINELKDLLNLCKQYKLKTCVYSGDDSVQTFATCLDVLDYLKIGAYNKFFGGLDCKYTNQKFFKVNADKSLTELTYLFQKDKK